MTVVGVALYGGVGVVNLALGGNYLDYNTLSHDVAHGQHIGIILVELGVGITVTSVMLNLFYLFAGYKGAEGNDSRYVADEMELSDRRYPDDDRALYRHVSAESGQETGGAVDLQTSLFPALYLHRQGC